MNKRVINICMYTGILLSISGLGTLCYGLNNIPTSIPNDTGDPSTYPERLNDTRIHSNGYDRRWNDVFQYSNIIYGSSLYIS